MQTIKIRIEKKYVPSFQYAIGQKNLNIKIISEKPLPGIIPSGDPNTEVEIQLLSDDLGELVTLGWFAGKQPLSLTLGETW